VRRQRFGDAAADAAGAAGDDGDPAGQPHLWPGRFDRCFR
jgi:hypothetical protein